MSFSERCVEKMENADFHELQGITAFHVNNYGQTYFDTQLQIYIREQCQSKTLYILRNLEAYHQLSDSQGRTLLHYAAESGNSEFAQHLISLGADVNAMNRSSETPLMIALKAVLSSPQKEAALELYRQKVLAQRVVNQNLFRASNITLRAPTFNQSIAEDDVLNVVKILIDAGAKLIDTIFRRIKIDDVLRRGSKKLVNVILESTIDLEFVDYMKLTPLHYLIENRRCNFSDELRGKNFDVDKRYEFGRTLLHHASQVGNTSFVRLLLNRGASINVVDDAKRTPLFWAFHSHAFRNMFGSDEKSPFINCIESLLDCGADPHIYDEHNSTVELRITDDRISEELITPIFTELILLEARGQPIKPIMQNYIDSNPQFKRIYDSVNDLIECMKETKIDDSLTLCDFMTANNVEILQFARRKNIYLNVSKFAKDFYSSASSYLHRKLQRRYSVLKQFVEWRDGSLAVTNEVFGKFCDLSLPNVIEKIVGHLECEKLIDIKRNSL